MAAAIAAPASGGYFYDPTGALGEPLFAALMKQLRLSPSTKEGGIVIAVKVGHHDRWAITRGVGHCHQSEESQQLRRNALSYLRQDRAEFMPLSLRRIAIKKNEQLRLCLGGLCSGMMQHFALLTTLDVSLVLCA